MRQSYYVGIILSVTVHVIFGMQQPTVVRVPSFNAYVISDVDPDDSISISYNVEYADRARVTSDFGSFNEELYGLFRPSSTVARRAVNVALCQHVAESKTQLALIKVQRWLDECGDYGSDGITWDRRMRRMYPKEKAYDDALHQELQDSTNGAQTNRHDYSDDTAISPCQCACSIQ